MSKKIEKELENILIQKIKEFSEMEPTSKEYTITENTIKVLLMEIGELSKEDFENNIAIKNIDLEFLKVDADMEKFKMNFENDKKKNENKAIELEIEKRKIDRRENINSILKLADNGADILKTVIPLSVTVWGIQEGLKFEETGTFTSSVMRNVFNRIFKF